MKECKNCGKQISNSKKFCNRSCAATYNNKHYPKRTKGREVPKCLGCGNEIAKVGGYYRYDRKYCSNKCQGNYISKQLLSEWKSGKPVFVKSGLPLWLKRHLLEEANHKCSSCGWGEKNPYTNNYTLEVDHIDGDAYNNLKENLRVLCPNCHSLTPTYKNIGSRKSVRNYRTQ